MSVRIIFYLLLVYKNLLFVKCLQDFICEDGTKIALSTVCNGEIDCPDGSDETKKFCYHVICPHDMFRCRYGACVHKVTKCNGKYECADKSDESQCGKQMNSCEKTEFKCDNGQCINIDEMCNGKEDCSDGSDETIETCEEFPCPVDTFHCKHGGCVHLEAKCNGYQDCVDGSDESDVCNILKKCSHGGYCSGYNLTCPPVISSRIRVVCEHKQKGIIPCDKPVPINTIAKFECKPHYQPRNEKNAINPSAVCQWDGTWSRKIFKCEPKCGKYGPDGIPMVVKGWSAKPGGYPWHAALYVKEEGEWSFWCGSSLITEKVVLTAGHCTWQIMPENMKIALGKFYSDLSKKQDFTQIINVKNVIIHPLYQDQSGNYGSDIAVLELEHNAELSQFVAPICLDWTRHDMDKHLTEGSIGLIVGMGVNENETFSETMRGTYLPVVDNAKCIKDQKQDFRKYITFTAFCAGWKNGTGVCNGDSGGGLVFPKVSNKNIYILEGIVSISPRRLGTSFCDPQYYTVFTKVGIYLDWIKRILRSIHPDYSITTGALESAFTG